MTNLTSIEFGILILAFTAVSFKVVAQTYVPKTELKVLAIGNSFSGNANAYREKLNENDSLHKLIVDQAYIGGCSFEKHITLARLHEQNPADPDGKPYTCNKQKVSLKDMLTAQPWDVVTIQQVSHLSDDITSYRPHAKDLCDYIKKYCPKAEIVVHEVWADRIDNARMKLKKKTQLEMYRDLDAAYREIAEELGNLRIIPAGDAFQNLRQIWKFQPDPNFDPQKMTYPNLPDQKHTLCIGWFWLKDKNIGEQKLGYDHHANQAGCLLAALVWRETLLGADSRENKFCPPEVSMDDAIVIRRIAHETVVNKLRPDMSSLTQITK